MRGEGVVRGRAAAVVVVVDVEDRDRAEDVVSVERPLGAELVGKGDREPPNATPASITSPGTPWRRISRAHHSRLASFSAER